jgi:hypothetical protein
MSSLAALPELVGFFSYSRSDDEHSGGALSLLRKRIRGELCAQLGRDLRLWQDIEAIPLGTLWEDQIKKAIAESAFFIPIITPSAVNSAFCRMEFQAFLDRETELLRDDLVFPILYISVPALANDDQRSGDEVLKIIHARQYDDWRDIRHAPVVSPEVGRQIAHFCEHIVNALHKRWESPEERRRREEVEARQRAEQEEARRIAEAEAIRLAEEERSRKEEAEARQRAEQEEARRRAEEERRRRAEAEERRRAAEALWLEQREQLRRAAEAAVPRRADAASGRTEDIDALERAELERERKEAERIYAAVAAGVLGFIFVGLAVGLVISPRPRPATPAQPVLETITSAAAPTQTAPPFISSTATLVQPASVPIGPLSPELERALKPKDIFKECDNCPEMVVVPAGRFMMGRRTAILTRSRCTR